MKDILTMMPGDYIIKTGGLKIENTSKDTVIETELPETYSIYPVKNFKKGLSGALTEVKEANVHCDCLQKQGAHCGNCPNNEKGAPQLPEELEDQEWPGNGYMLENRKAINALIKYLKHKEK